MHIKHISYRVEFQGRGAAHIHGTLWLDVRKIESFPPFEKKNAEQKPGNLSNAFCKLRENSKLNDDEKDAIVTLTDMLISCCLNAAIVSQRVVDIALDVNCHHCTRKCEGKCKYGFPRFPLKETVVVDKNEFSNSKEDYNMEHNINEPKNYHKILSDVEDVLINKEIIEKIFNKFPNKGETKEKYDEYRDKRI